MRERINRLARGIVDTELPKLSFSQTKVEETVEADSVYKRELHLSSENGLYVKGLVYSSHSRVKVTGGSSFGGMRNHIAYEVDTRWCENGDTIKGVFSFVTNSGEYEIPYVFHVELTASVRVISSLVTVEDFVSLARKDMDMALRLMNYQDFNEAPFMKDLRVNTIYSGLKGHGDVRNVLEEFLLALGAKEPVKLSIPTDRKAYECRTEVITDRIVITKNTWGYVYIEVRSKENFIEIMKKTVTQADFSDDRYELRFRIHPERMHVGRNLGAIHLSTVHGDTVIRIEARAGGRRETVREGNAGGREAISDRREKTVGEGDSGGRKGAAARGNANEEIPVGRGAKNAASAKRSAQNETAGQPGMLEKDEISKPAVCRYMKLREQLESGIYETPLIAGRIADELDSIKRIEGDTLTLELLAAENYIALGRKEDSLKILERCRGAVYGEREEDRCVYGFFQYLYYISGSKDRMQLQTLIGLLQDAAGKSDVRGRFCMRMLLLRLEPDFYGEGASLYFSLKELHDMGCNNPFLYIEAAKVLDAGPEIMTGIDGFSAHTLFYAARHGLAGERLVKKAAGLAAAQKTYRRLYYRALAVLYEKFPSEELLAAICAVLIKANAHGPEAFPWYEAGVNAEISLTRIYEYYLYSLPRGFDGKMPRQVLLYFSYEDRHLDYAQRAELYKNVLTYVDPDSELYRTYEHKIQEFAMDQLFKSRISASLAVIYRHMVYRDVIDREVAKILPSILNACRISCAAEGMKYVVVSNEYLSGEDAYQLDKGEAYVPLFFEDSVIMFQDNYGNRYMDVPYTKEPAMDGKELEDKCFEEYPGHPMLRMRECLRLMGRKTLNSGEAAKLESALGELPVRPLYGQQMLAKVVAFYKDQSLDEDEAVAREGGDYLRRLDKDKLSRHERIGVCETLIAQGCFAEAYAMVYKFGEDGVRIKSLARLCSKMALNGMFAHDELLLHLSYRVFAAGKADSVILDYLCEHFNGTCDQMYRLLMQSVREHVATYDLEERLLAQLLFTGDMYHLDNVFDLYVSRKDTAEPIVRAYFTIKSADYFLKDSVPADRVFEYLEGALDSSKDFGKVPEIYLLALAKYYSGLPSLDAERQALIKRVMEYLLGEGYVFSCFKKLSRYVDLPAEITDKEIVEYHGSAGSKPILMMRVLPDEEQFYEEEMRLVYKGIYIRQQVLFEGEIMEYEIYEDEGEKRVKKAEGEISCESAPGGDRQGRLSRLNEMAAYLAVKDDKKLKVCMERYAEDSLMAGKLFGLA